MHALRHLPSLVVAAAASLPAQTNVESLRGMLPEEAVAVFDVAAPSRAVAELQRAMGDLPEALPAAVRVPLWVGLVAVWASLNGNPEAWADRVAGGGAVMGLVPAGGGLQSCVVLRPNRIEVARSWLQRHAERATVVVAGDVLVVSTDALLCERVAARAKEPPSRWGKVEFGEAAAVRGVVDMAAARQMANRDAPNVESLDAGGRFVFAPIVHALANAVWMRLALTGGDRVAFSARVDAGVHGPFAELLSPAGGGPVVGLADDGLLSLRLHRSLRALLKSPERFLPPEGVQAVRGFLSIADAIDGVRTSFLDDLLGGLGEPFELLVSPITPVDDGPAPRLQLPGFAITAPLRDPAAAAILFRAAQLFLIIANAERAQRGQSLFTARMERGEQGRGLVAEPMAWRGPGAPPIEQALSPTVWCENGVVVMASTKAAALAVVQRAKARAPVRSGDEIVFRGPAVALALASSRRVLELARMLDEGEDATAASRFFDVLLVASGAIREATLRVQYGAASTQLDLTLERVR